MTRTVIPKDCAVCDCCNNAVTDEKFIALDDAMWREGWLYCKECEEKYKPTSVPLIQAIKKGDDLSKTDLALPIIMEFD